MDDRIKHIIESGLMESYLLGQCSEQQTQEIDDLLENSEELKKYFNELEELQFALTEPIAKNPPKEMKERIKEAIRNSEEPSQTFKKAKANENSSISFERVVLIASVLCLFISLFTAFSLFMKNLELQNTLDKSSHLLKEHDSYTRQMDMQLDLMQLRIEKLQDRVMIVNDGQTKKIPLIGKTNIGELNLVAYWNKAQKASVLSIENLPKLPNKQCFQLWADVKGEMISLGVIENNDFIVDLEYLENAESLNVTIELEGGSLHPTVSRLVASKAI